ncbi:malate oxidoreductase [Paenibacillus baekrokdamisoli]|uniref:Malate oxidoreductase n=1 Tax=Paenibacillus baekrokdamisoli TaxID=1712516 RepID=A0A3G9IK58_9BACL|nr:NAD-dependent malic enzyme [Paenibacillus baekrokdamisoli]MBB3069366.1 malate dehydrogenase (oxaloacetate-decarboxylating) [Paenibacillus baekrokdamisoli]BBH18666.1 malate oxidoreductase [Paenibacillus baekrokdamisoli]
MSIPTGANTNMILRLELDKEIASFGNIATAIGDSGGDIVATDVVRTEKKSTVRDITFSVYDQKHSDLIVEAVGKLPGVKVVHVSDQTFLLHLGGKIEMATKFPIKNRDDLSRVYTPGVARVSMAIHENKARAHSLTIKRNTVAVISDGSAVLGLGNIGPEAAMPVMEGKAMLFKQLAGVDAFPICLATQDVEEILLIVKALSPGFGGINLEDISAPRCFDIEKRLVEELDIPVFHDDQHGTAVVLMAGLINAVKLVGKKLEDCKIVVCGIGAAGTACTRMLLSAGVTNIIGVDRQGAILKGKEYENPFWQWYAENTNPHHIEGSLSEVIEGADVFIGVSGPGVLKAADVKKMAADSIVFAMANPSPEIMPEEAEPYVRVMATGRSDYPNQINNVLCFPGMFRGALDCRATKINEEMKLAASHAIASVVSDDELNENYIIPSVFNHVVVEKVREAVINAAYKSGVAQRRREKVQ